MILDPDIYSPLINILLGGLFQFKQVSELQVDDQTFNMTL